MFLTFLGTSGFAKKPNGLPHSKNWLLRGPSSYDTSLELALEFLGMPALLDWPTA